MSSLVVTADSASATAARRAPWLAIAMVGLAFLIAEQRPSASRLDDFAVDTDQMAVESEGGSPTRRLGFSLIALLGAVGLMRPPRYPLEMRSALAVLGVFYIGWSLASLAWSEDPASTARRLVVVVFCFLGVLGLCRQLSVRDVAVLALALNAFYILLGLGAELALGSFRPWSGSYRFAGMAHPNSQGAYCAVLCIAALSLLGRDAGRTRLMAATFAAGLVLLVLTKSRTAVIGFAAAMTALGCLRMPLRAKTLAIVAAGFTLSAILLAAAVSGVDLQKRIAEAALLGRQEDAESFNGRVPLWTELVTTYVAKRPWCGYGYGTFWNARHIEETSATFYWGIREAHSAYVESLLGTGLIGTGVLLLAALAGLRRAVVRYRATDDGGYAFVAAMIVFALVQGIMESGFVLPFFLSFLAAAGLGKLAFCRDEQEARQL